MGYKEGGRLDWVRKEPEFKKQKTKNKKNQKLHYHLQAYEWRPLGAYGDTAETF